MSIQELTGELQALSLAYPDSAQVLVHSHGIAAPITGVTVDSDESGVAVFLEGAL